MSDGLHSLQGLTRILLDAELAKLRHLSAETRLRQDEVARLDAALAARTQTLASTDPLNDLAFRTGQDAQWQAWTARAKKRLMRELAEAAAQREAQRKKAQHAFGQVEALAGIRQIEEDEKKLREARKLHADPDRTGQPG